VARKADPVPSPWGAFRLIAHGLVGKSGGTQALFPTQLEAASPPPAISACSRLPKPGKVCAMAMAAVEVCHDESLACLDVSDIRRRMVGPRRE